jgi:glycosyltransferase involved in cell wall biosynthesis
LRLAFVTGSLVHGGAERQAITLANRLAERGHDCHLVYVKNDPSQLGRLRLPPRSIVRCLHASRYFDLRALSHLQAFFGRLNADAVLATNPYALMYAALASTGAPLAATLHSTYLRLLKERLQMLAYRPLFWRSACTVFVCERQKSHWLRRGVFGRRNLVIYNGIDLDDWQPLAGGPRASELRRLLGFADGDFVVGLSAVLRPEKNPAQLVEAICRLWQQGVPAKALFIGDGPEREKVLQTSRRLGVEERVVISGFQDDVRPFVSLCDAMALTSFTEAFSLAAIEAMALGRPVVHAEVGGAAEMIQSGHDGWLFPVGDTDTLVERLAALADPVARARMGENARATVTQRFSERAMVERYEQMLSDLVSRRTQSGPLRKRATAH